MQFLPLIVKLLKLLLNHRQNGYIKELRGFAPIGMLECWNTGIMGFGELTEWVIGKIKLTNHKKNSDLIHSVEDGFTSFHYSTISLFHV
jgi:hypothetical protein